MKECFSRVDERLLHGQITTAWIKALHISHVFVVEDGIASDKLAGRVMSMMVPPRVELQIVSVDRMAHMGDELFGGSSEKRVMLLFRTLADAWRFVLCSDSDTIKELNLGGIPYRIDRQQYDRNIFLSSKEYLILQNMIQEHHIRVFSQVLPSDPQVDLRSLINIK